MTVQFIEIGGEKMAVMPAADYAKLVADAEDRSDADAAASAQARREAGEEYLPSEMVDRLLSGGMPLRVWRNHRRMTLRELGEKTGISYAHISDMERGRRSGTLEKWRRLAAALKVDLDDIVPPEQG